MKTFGALVLCWHVSSSTGESMNGDNGAFGTSSIDHASKCKQNDDDKDTKSGSVIDSLDFYKDHKNCGTPKLKNENKNRIKYVPRNNKELHTANAKRNSFINEHYRPPHHKYNFSTREDLKAKDRLRSIEKSLSDAFAKRNQTKLDQSYSEYILLMARYGAIARLHIQIAECMELMSQTTKSKPTLDGRINLFNEVMIMTEVTDADFTLFEKRRIVFLSLRGDFDHITSVTKKLLGRFPRNLHELKKLAEIQYAFSNTLDALDMFERLIELAPSDQFATTFFGRMKAFTALHPSTRMLSKLGNVKKELQKRVYTKALNDNKNNNSYNISHNNNNNNNNNGNDNDNKDSETGILSDLEDENEITMRALNTISPAIVSRMCSKNAVLSVAIINHCGEALIRSGRYEEADTIFERAGRDGLLQTFWKRPLNFLNGLTARPIWNIEQTGIASLLYQVQNQWENIREEALIIAKRKLFTSQGEGISTSGKWGVYALYSDGIRLKENCLNAPLTCSLMEKIPQISNTPQIRGCVTFSNMEAGTHVSPHAGPTNSRIRIHLGLKVPPVPINITSTANLPCKARVLNEYFTWEDGKINIFDDSFEHEVWQLDPLKRPRLVLIMDVVHPELTDQQLVLL